MREVLMKGIDVSTHQGKIDWAKVKKSGHADFAIIRIGFRGYGQAGTIKLDKQFVNNAKGATEQLIPLGAYFYSTAINEAEAIEEARFCIEQLEPYRDNIKLPVVYDFEGYGKTNYRTYGISQEQRTKNYKAFTETLNAAGYEGLIYGSKAYIRSKFDVDNLDELMWLAAYPKTPDINNPPSIGTYDSRVAMWQYSSSGSVPGINGRVDMNAMYINLIKSDKPSNPYNTPTRTLCMGNPNMTEEDVRWLQWELVDDKYEIGIDGNFDKTTNALLRDYQYNHGLEVDGKCGPATRRNMINS